MGSHPDALDHKGRLAECNSAIRQIENLRYHSYWLPFWVRSARGGEDRFTRL